MSRPDLSVIMPAFNAEETIGSALASILDETAVAAEVIIVNDGSTDTTATIVQRLGAEDRRVRLLTTGRSGCGASTARNVALDAACGRWIGLLDADDLWEPGRAAVALTAAEAHNADMVADDVRVVGYGGESTTLFRTRGMAPVQPGQPLTQHNLARHDLGLLQPFVRSDVIERGAVRFPAKGRATEDFAFIWMCVGAASKAILMPDPLYVYRKRPGSVSSASERFWLDSMSVTQELMNGIPDGADNLRHPLQRRLTSARSAYFYLVAQRLARERKPLTALGLVVRHPGVAVVGARSVKHILRMRRHTGA